MQLHGDCYSGYLVGKPNPGTGEFVRKPAQQILRDKHLGLLTLGWGGEAERVVKGQDKQQ